MRRRRWWHKLQADRYRAGELAPGEHPQPVHLKIELGRDHPHWGIWLKLGRWVYRARVVWR